MALHVFLTGPPGVGKTTLIQKTIAVLSAWSSGLALLRLEPLPGKRECRVGQYVVDLTSFEQLALPVLRNAGPNSGPGQRVCVIDEIGKMELFSQPFIQAVHQTLATPGTVVLGTIPLPKGKPLAFVEEIRHRNDVKVFNVTKENRNHLLPAIVTCVQSSRK
ncbi:cancer-related nucleoside-triphosphatase isoform X3 [Manis pentadactyla]|uniref:cancer-related nucleoside-triphosphatase isoform X3 n=1 Tax=Manis pentadactyla TaxID=143292 RepID=UPI00255C826D|nr:cancer-related nucleoside-triphosphatase isoform X3 [Manis pentadactyla]